MNPMNSNTGVNKRGFTGDRVPKGYNVGQLQQFTPEQLQQFQQLFGLLGPESDLYKMASGDQSFFEEMERPALRDFGALQGNIAARFSNAGMGARRSSGFQNTMNREGSDFSQRLAANRQNLSRQALQDLFQMSNLLMNQRPYERDLFEKQQKDPALGGFGGALGALGGGVAGFFAGGPAGAFAGANIGSRAFSGL